MRSNAFHFSIKPLESPKCAYVCFKTPDLNTTPITRLSKLRLLTYKAIVLLDFQNVAHVPQAAGGEPVGVLFNLGGGLWVHQEPSFAFGYLRVAAVSTLVVLTKMKQKVKGRDVTRKGR